jgi:hypothetical protein
MVLVAWRFRRQRVRSRLTANRLPQGHLSKSFIFGRFFSHTTAPLPRCSRRYAPTPLMPIRSSSLVAAPLRYANPRKASAGAAGFDGHFLAAAQGCSIGDI